MATACRTHSLAAVALIAGATTFVPHPAHAAWEPNGVAVCAASGDQTRPVVVADGQGGAFVVWEDARTLPPQVYAQRLNALGDPQWGAHGIQVSSGTYSQTAPVATYDGIGGVIIAWILQIVPEARTGQGQRLNSAGAPLWSAGGIPVIPGAAFPVQLAIISDLRQPIVELPGAILAWTDIRNGITTDIYAAAISTTGAPRWNATVCTAAGNQSDLVMVTDGSSATLSQPKGAILAWYDERVSTSNADIYAQRLNAGGAVQWTADGLAIDARTSNVQAPVIVNAGSGTAIVAWPGPGPSRTYALWAQRAGTAGAWPGDGVLVAPPQGGQLYPAAISDGAGGMLIVWAAFGPGLQRDLFAQRLSSTGAPVWASSGITLCDVPGTQVSPVVVPGRSQSAVVAWEDRRLTESDIYVQLLGSDGVRQWTPDGVPLCVAPGNQSAAAAAPDTTGGAIVAWVDERNGNRDIYAQRVTGGGGVVAVPALSPSGLRLGAPFPNPARSGVAFRLDLARASEVSAGIFDVQGRRVRNLFAERALPAGAETLVWNGDDDGGVRVPPGLYWVVLRAGSEQVGRRMVILSR